MTKSAFGEGVYLGLCLMNERMLSSKSEGSERALIWIQGALSQCYKGSAVRRSCTRQPSIPELPRKRRMACTDPNVLKASRGMRRQRNAVGVVGCQIVSNE